MVNKGTININNNLENEIKELRHYFKNVIFLLRHGEGDVTDEITEQAVRTLDKRLTINNLRSV
jgi:hypothetical protein